MDASVLAQVLRDLPPITDPNVLVGTSTADDAGVYKLRDDLAIVQTVDFFTPIVDDPYTYGSIAAANSISDVYAMGATPLTALAIVAFPEELDPSILQAVLRGGTDKAREAGINIIGGHTIKDKEPKYGLSVTGIVHPDRVWRNSNAQPGDVFFSPRRSVPAYSQPRAAKTPLKTQLWSKRLRRCRASIAAPPKWLLPSNHMR